MQSAIIIENFRGFRGRNEVQLSPLTLVTGAPNSGKSTLLFAMAAASELARGETPDFNRQPLQLGGFAQIASPGAETFSVGTSNNGTRIEARFRDGPHGQPEWDVFAVAGSAGTMALSGTPGESPRATWIALNGVEQRLPWTFYPETPRIPAALAADALRALLVAEDVSPGAQALLASCARVAARHGSWPHSESPRNAPTTHARQSSTRSVRTWRRPCPPCSETRRPPPAATWMSSAARQGTGTRSAFAG